MTDIAELGFAIDREGNLDKGTKGLNNLKNAADRAERSTGALGKTAHAMTGAFRNFTTQLIATAGAAFALHKMIGSALGLSSALAEVSTLLPTVGRNLEQVEDAAHNMARTFGTTATEQVNAFYQVFSAGAETVAEATNTLNAANKLAVGGVTDIKTAADGLTSVLNAYGSKVGTATDVSDAMFVAMRAGKTTIGELSSSLGRTAPIAATLGVSFDELVASIAALTKGGISTKEAVTGVRAILAAVAKPTSEAAKLANALGLEFNSAALSAQGFAGFLDTVVAKTGGNNDALAQLFGGVEALVPVMALAGQAGEDFNAILDQMSRKSGETDEAFLRVARSAEFKARTAFSRLADAGVLIGKRLLEDAIPSLESLADTITDPKFIAGMAAFGSAIIRVIDAIAQVAAGAMNALNALWDNVSNSPGFKNAMTRIAPIDERSIGVLENQLKSAQAKLNDALTNGGAGWFSTNWGADEAIKGLEGDIAKLKSAIADRLSPEKFDLSGSFKLLGNDPQAAYGSMEEALAAFRGEKTKSDAANKPSSSIDIQSILDSFTDAGKEAGKLQEKYDKIILSANQRIEQLGTEANALKMTTFEADKLRFTQDLLNQAANDNIQLTPDRLAQLDALAEKEAQAQLALDGMLTSMENQSPWDTAAQNIANLNEMLAAGALSWDGYASAVGRVAEDMVGKYASAATGIIGQGEKLTNALGLQGKEQFEAQKAFSIANAIVSGGEAVVKSYNWGTTLGGPVGGAIAAGLAAAATAAQIAAIASTSYTSKSAPSAAASGGGASAAAAPAAPSRTVNVHLNGSSNYSGEQIAELLHEYAADGGSKINVIKAA